MSPFRTDPRPSELARLAALLETEVAERRRVERRLRIKDAVTAILAEAEDLTSAAPHILQAICEALEWRVGSIWLPDESESTLLMLSFWHASGVEAAAFEADSRGRAFAPGQGLPGRVWRSRTPLWVPDVVVDPDFPRGPTAQRAGLHGAFAFPIVGHGKVLGVVELFAPVPLEPDPDLLKMSGVLGNYLGIFAERRRAVEALRRSQRDLSDLVESANIGLHWVGPDGRILWANRAELEMLGYGHDEYVGRNIAEFHADRAVIEDVLARLHRGERLNGVPARMRHKDGSLRHVRLDSSVLWEDGRFVHTRCFTTDVTETLRAETAMRDSEERMRTIVETALDAVVAVDDDGRIVEWNPQAERMLGWTREEALGRSLVETVVPPETVEPEEIAPLISGARDRIEPTRFESVALHRDGRRIPVEIAVSPGSKGGRHVFSAFLRDVSDRHALEEMRRKSADLEAEKRHLEETSRLKSQFLANVSHELRTPMNAIIGFAQLMFDGRVGPMSPAHREYVGDILTSATHLMRLINDVLDLAKVEAGRIEVRPEDVDISAACTEVVDVLRGLADQKRMRVSIEVDPAVARVTTDRAKLLQVLYNYLSNALKFTPEGGRVAVRVLPHGDHDVRVEVRDTGIGIRPEHRARLFTEFQQLDQGPAKRYPGTGLGLAVTRRIVEAQGGSVGVESQPGKGSVFFALLPRFSRPPS